MHEVCLVSNIMHLTINNSYLPMPVCNPACVWFFAPYEWSFSTNALSSLQLSSWRAELNPTEPLKEQLQDHINVLLRDDGQMWTNCAMWDSFLPAWRQVMTVSWDSRKIAHVCFNKHQHKLQTHYEESRMWSCTTEITSPLYTSAEAQLLRAQSRKLFTKSLSETVIES